MGHCKAGCRQPLARTHGGHGLRFWRPATDLRGTARNRIALLMAHNAPLIDGVPATLNAARVVVTDRAGGTLARANRRKRAGVLLTVQQMPISRPRLPIAQLPSGGFGLPNAATKVSWARMYIKRTLIIVPVLDDEGSLTTLIRELARELADRTGISMLVVDDGSVPPIDLVDVGALDGQVITLSRNLGHQKAIAIGLAHAVAHSLADVIVVMDADGEDRPGDVARMLDAVESGPELSLVVAQRTKRHERLSFRVFYQLYRLLFFLLTGHHISFGNFSAIPIAAGRRLVAMNELWVSFPATLIRSRLPIVELPTHRGKRYHGQPRMNFVSLVTLGFGAVSTFLENALTRMILGASGLVAVSVFASVVAAVLKLLGMATPGWLTTVTGVSMVLMIGVAILSFVGLALTILAGSQTVPAPSTIYPSFIARISKFGPNASAR